ncbi:hypothetical protein AB0D12_16145 [Streptomyces sp. NPDC048479]|uniref:hypothetical protein n=1 Tax=Streptomyces sp. NPDC048479 TaxID=3154725 RepID=UPI0034120993
MPGYLIGSPFLYLLAIAAGTVVSAGLLILPKGMGRTETEAAVTGTSAAEEAKVPVAA